MYDLQERIKKTIFEEQLINDGDRIIAAVSGGADSLSLLYILNEIRQEKSISFSLHVAHLNHGLRGKQARGDAEYVRQEAEKAGLPCTVGIADTIAFGRRHKLSIEDAARRLRYRFLEQLSLRIGATGIAVGHNRDDQAETLLLNLLRGTGLDGLSGMKFKRKMKTGTHTLIRPLLGISRSDIEKYCRHKKLSPRLDATNRDTRFLRNKIRLELLPFLEKEYNPNIRKGLEQLSYLLTQDRNFLQGAALRRLNRIILKEEAASHLELDLKTLVDEHAAMQGRILRLAFQRLLGAIPREVGYRHIQAVLKLCREGPPHGTLDLPSGLKIARSYNTLEIVCGKSTKHSRTEDLSPFYLAVPGEKAIPGHNFFLQAAVLSPESLSWPPEQQREAYLDYDQAAKLAGAANVAPGIVTSGSNKDSLLLFVRPRREGDLFYPLGAPGRKKLKEYFIDQKIPLKKRDQIPLVLAGDHIIWIAGKQISHDCRVTDDTKKVLVLKLTPGS
ncbi:MAG: tRNA lysidine(34) synthetase TilS [Firmicutes bacterium]|nr:tRNA lysidine(34) synthetase TilS [Bacillota bacterium]